jgi:membrane protease YdiL (CAAX protease family)
VTGPPLRRPRDRERLALPVLLLLVLVVTWAVWVPRALESAGVLGSRWATEVGAGYAYGPAIAAVLAAVWVGRPALRDLGARLTRWRVGIRWWAVVLAGPALLGLATAVLHTVLGGDWSDVRPQALDAGVTGLVPLFLALALTDGLGEEVGWRGAVLPRLLRRTGPVAASLLLGVVWAVWHAPLHWTEGATMEGTPVWLLLVQLPACAVLYTWVFLHTGGSVLPAIALHAALSLSGVPLPAAGSDWRPYLLFAGLQVTIAAVLAGTGQLHDPGHRRGTVDGGEAGP